MLSENHEMGFPTDEQQAVLTSTARICIVKACPGSGKTRVFVEFLKKQLENWPPLSKQGIAALSFTNVAQEEIKNRIDKTIIKPHFIGTLDSFILAYVVKPFAHVVGVSMGGVELLPEIVAERYDYPLATVGSSQMRGRAVDVRKCIHTIRFVKGSVSHPQLQYYCDVQHKNIEVDDNKQNTVLSAKQREWGQSGRITHSDTHYLAAKILSDENYGEAIAQLINRKFPVILIDEFQDTGNFLSIALEKLLKNCKKSLVIGDPDQSIYEFGGASPNIFESIESLHGVEVLPLSISHRFGPEISEMVKTLSDSGRDIASGDTTRNGSAYIISHSQDAPILSSELSQLVGNCIGSTEKYVVLTRKRLTKNKLMGKQRIQLPNRFATTGKKILLAQESLYIGEFQKGKKIVESLLSKFIFNKGVPREEDFKDKNIDRNLWNSSVLKIINSISSPTTEKWNEWLERMKALFKDELEKHGFTDNIGNQFRKNSENDDVDMPHIRVVETDVDNSHLLEISTIHQFKGAESDNVVFYVPKRSRSCISNEWWEDNSEEKRIAFVALSRARKNIILCIHQDTLNTLRQTRSEFVEKFEVIE